MKQWVWDKVYSIWTVRCSSTRILHMVLGGCAIMCLPFIQCFVGTRVNCLVGDLLIVMSTAFLMSSCTCVSCWFGDWMVLMSGAYSVHLLIPLIDIKPSNSILMSSFTFGLLSLPLGLYTGCTCFLVFAPFAFGHTSCMCKLFTQLSFIRQTLFHNSFLDSNTNRIEDAGHLFTNQCNQSHSILDRDSAVLQWSESFRNSVTNSEMNSPWWQECEWKLKLLMATDDGGCFWSWTSLANSKNDSSDGFTGETKFLISWYMNAPHTLKRIACGLAAFVTSLVVKYSAGTQCRASRPLACCWISRWCHVLPCLTLVTNLLYLLR